jgi:hypothetical protein
MLEEPAEPSMFDDIQTIQIASNDKIGKVFGVLNENLRLCLICEEVFTMQGAAEHADVACSPKRIGQYWRHEGFVRSQIAEEPEEGRMDLRGLA